jgi:hypothetical protein
LLAFLLLTKWRKKEATMNAEMANLKMHMDGMESARYCPIPLAPDKEEVNI